MVTSARAKSGPQTYIIKPHSKDDSQRSTSVSQKILNKYETERRGMCLNFLFC